MIFAAIATLSRQQAIAILDLAGIAIDTRESDETLRDHVLHGYITQRVAGADVLLVLEQVS